VKPFQVSLATDCSLNEWRNVHAPPMMF